MEDTTIIDKEVISNYLEDEQGFVQLEDEEDDLVKYELLDKLTVRIGKLESSNEKLTEENKKLEDIIREQNNTIMTVISSINKLVESTTAMRRSQLDSNEVIRDLISESRANSVSLNNIDKSLSIYANNNANLIKEYNASVSDVIGYSEGVGVQYGILNKELDKLKAEVTNNSKDIHSAKSSAHQSELLAKEAMDKASEHDSILNKIKGFGGLFSK